MKKRKQNVLTELEDSRILERPDGYYWQSKITGDEAGPFATVAEAFTHMESVEDSDFEEGETLAEAESEIGISEWIDPDTGVPAEEGVPRLEDH
jgi:hypothetical protein